MKLLVVIINWLPACTIADFCCICELFVLLLLLLLSEGEEDEDEVVNGNDTIDDVGNTDELAPFNNSLLLLHDILNKREMCLKREKKID